MKPNVKRNKLLNKCGVYIITNTLTGDYYGGSSVNISRRWKNHKASAKRGSTKCPHLYAAMRKYGIDNFTIKILSECISNNLIDREQAWLNDNVGKEKCYNISKFADNPTRGRTLSEEHKKKLRKPKHIKNPRQRGYHLSDKHKQSISKSLFGKKKTLIHAQHISDSVKGKPKKYENGRIGEFNPNSKLKQSDVEIIRNIYTSGKTYTELAHQFDVSRNTIRNVIMGNTYVK